MISRIKVLEGGKIIIPENIRNNLGISIGDEITISKNDNILFLDFEDGFEDISKCTKYLLRELWDNEEDEKWSQELIEANKISFKEI